MSHPSRQLTSGEIEAYLLGQQLAAGRKVRRVEARRRRVHTDPDGRREITEEVIYISEDI